MSVAQDTAAQLVQNIFDLQRALRGVTASGTKHSDLGAAHTAVLFFIREGGALRASALAGKLGIGPSALSRHLADLEESGLVVRSPDPLDRRACLLSLSGQGELYLAETYERRAENLRQILSDWTESEAETASSSVQHLTRALRSATPPSTGNDGRHHLDTASDITKEEH